MRFRPYSIERAPRALPIWHAIIEDLGNPPPARIAAALGISWRSVYRYHKTGQAPRPILLALFWLTRWGQSQLDAEMVNNCSMAVGLAEALQTEVRQLRDQVAHLIAIGDYGAANTPLGVSVSPRTHHAPQLEARAGQAVKTVREVRHVAKR